MSGLPEKEIGCELQGVSYPLPANSIFSKTDAGTLSKTVVGQCR